MPLRESLSYFPGLSRQTQDVISSKPPFRLGDLVEQVDDFYPQRDYSLFIILDAGEPKTGRWIYRGYVLESTTPEIRGTVQQFRFSDRHIIEECLILSRI